MDLFGPEGPVTVAILGSTGSVGRQALEVIEALPHRFEVVALGAGSDKELLISQAKRFGVPLIGISQGDIDPPDGVKVIDGPDSAERLVEESGAQIVLNAVVGAAGLKATAAAVVAGKTLSLANKESLVAAGEWVMAKASPGQIRPVDSEHSALWQLLEGVRGDKVRRIYLTGSGGPFRGKSKDELAEVTIEQALAHPVWKMGRKISVDSATHMNKGLEVIEAHFLFGFTYDEIDVLIHPQGLVHGMAEMIDGGVTAYAAKPDMKLPIQVALAWPDGASSPEDMRVTWPGTTMSFETPDPDTFRCLALGYEAGRLGDTYPAVLNAANEVAVQAFLDGKIAFLGIPALVEQVLDEHQPTEASLDGVLEQDAWARSAAADRVKEMSG